MQLEMSFRLRTYLRGDLEIKEIVSQSRDADGGRRDAMRTEGIGVGGSVRIAEVTAEEPENVPHFLLP